MKSYRVLKTVPIVTINPLSAWTELMIQIEEILTASAHVIGHRTALMARVGSSPNQCDQREFIMMSQEKLEATAEAAHAMAIRLLSLHQEFARLTFQQILSGTANFMSVARSNDLHQSGHRQSKLARDTMIKSVEAVAQINTSLANIAQTGLHPIHIRATANAKRLTKRDTSVLMG